MIPTNYTEANSFLGIKNKRIIKNKRSTYMRRNDDNIELIYHNTAVATYYPDNTVSLNSGGYHTLTTRTRMNNALGNRGYIFQKNFKWFFKTDDLQIPFKDGIRI